MGQLKNITKHDYLSSFMDLYWLRPETALWRTLDCAALMNVDFKGRILDLGCGDGLFNFVRAGGKIHPAFDVFCQVGDLEHFFENVDIYNHHDDSGGSPMVVTKPAYQIAVGLDHKQSLLTKAFATGLYDKVVEADANEPMPLDAGSFETIFSNILYWLENYRGTLREAHRILADDGKLVVHVPSETFSDYSFYQRLHVKPQNPDWQWLERLDRGRSENIKQRRPFDDWVADFEEAGFKVAQHRRYLSRTVLEAWDIGLRPLSPFLIEMSNKLTPEDRLDIKQKWVNGLMPLLEPLCELDWPTDRESPPGFFMFVLEKI